MNDSFDEKVNHVPIRRACAVTGCETERFIKELGNGRVFYPYCERHVGKVNRARTS